MLETLRDLHDLSTMPLVLVGMAGFDRRLQPGNFTLPDSVGVQNNRAFLVNILFRS